MEGCGAAEEGEDHDGDGEEEDATAAEAIDQQEGYDGEDRVGSRDGKGGKCWSGKAEEGEEGSREVH